MANPKHLPVGRRFDARGRGRGASGSGDGRDVAAKASEPGVVDDRSDTRIELIRGAGRHFRPLFWTSVVGLPDVSLEPG